MERRDEAANVRAWRVAVPVLLVAVVVLLLLTVAISSMAPVFGSILVITAAVTVIGILTVRKGDAPDPPQLRVLKVMTPIIVALMVAVGVWWLIQQSLT